MIALNNLTRYLSIGAVLVVLTTGLSDAESIRIGGTGGALGTMRLLGQAFKKQQPSVAVVVVPGLGSGGGRRALMGGALDIAVTALPLAGVEKLAGARAALLGGTPFVMAVAAKNSVVNLTLQDIAGIYSGKLTAWPNGERLRLILRPESDSDTELLKALSAEVERAVKSAFAREGMKIAITDEECADAIQTTPGAVGSSTQALIISEKRDLKALSINGVAPNVKTLGDGSYPWFKSFYLLTRAESSPASKLFVEFASSPQGRKILFSLGHWLPETKATR